MRFFPALSAIFLSLLVSCSGGTSSGITESTPSTKVNSSGSLLMQVRAAGQVGNELDVQPLRDPQVEDLRALATQSENRGDYASARQILAKASALAPNDPDLLQWQAEMALAMRDWAQAEQFATRSYDKGPKLGGLCRRNWTTLRLAAQSRGNAAGAAQAQQRVAACTVAPPTRM
jgi:tetratricopeptide (TPR) repeat protein